MHEVSYDSSHDSAHGFEMPEGVRRACHLRGIPAAMA